MKKLIALLSITAFIAVNVHAQSPAQTQEAKKEVSVAKDNSASDVKAKPAAHSCCMKGTAAASAEKSGCCKGKDASKCTAEEKAACAKAGKDCSHANAKGCDHDHAKADVEKTKGEKTE